MEAVGSESDSGTPEPAPAPPPKPAPEPSEWSLALARRAQLIPSPEDCPHMFRPSLEPLAVPRIQSRNSARRVQQARRDISKVEVIEASTYRVLFEFDEPTLAQLRERANRPPDWDPNERPMVELAWEVALLIYIGDDPLPFLAFPFHDGQLYFVIKAANGEVVGVSETYTAAASREGGVAAVKVNAPVAGVEG